MKTILFQNYKAIDLLASSAQKYGISIRVNMNKENSLNL